MPCSDDAIGRFVVGRSFWGDHVRLSTPEWVGTIAV
jgi:hypothetical protein